MEWSEHEGKKEIKDYSIVEFNLRGGVYKTEESNKNLTTKFAISAPHINILDKYLEIISSINSANLESGISSLLTT